jgi:hypothetical protein
MKIRFLKTDWLAPLVGIGVVVGSLAGAKTYLALEERARAADARAALLERIYQGQQLSLVLKAMHNGEFKGASQSLDCLLCDDILYASTMSESADAATQAVVLDAFRRIARARPMVAQGASAGSSKEATGEQVAAEQILARSLASGQAAKAK